MKTMIDLDNHLLQEAARELGTTTKKDTVHAALSLAATRKLRMTELFKDPLSLGVGADIGNADIMREARR
jgi:Arc/MetJ family transcription regulator